MALCVLAAMTNLVPLGARARGAWAATPSLERWALWMSGAGLAATSLWHVAELLQPAWPKLSYLPLAASVSLFALAILLGVIRRSRMPKESERPHTLMLD